MVVIAITASIIGTDFFDSGVLSIVLRGVAGYHDGCIGFHGGSVERGRFGHKGHRGSVSDATIKGNHVELDGVFVEGDVLIHIKGHREREVAVGVDVTPSDDSTVNEGLVVRLNDDVEHAAHAQIQAVVRIDRAGDGHLAFGQELFTVVDVERKFWERGDAERDFVGTNGLAGRTGNDHRVIAFGQVVSECQRQDGHEGRLALSEVEFGRHTVWNDGREAHIGAKAVYGFNKDGRGDDPGDAAGKHNPRVHRLNLEVRRVVHGEGHGNRAVSPVMGAGDGQFVIPAAEVHGIHDHCAEVVDG